jgi:hypothetical protein
VIIISHLVTQVLLHQELLTHFLAAIIPDGQKEFPYNSLFLLFLIHNSLLYVSDISLGIMGKALNNLIVIEP